jgi:hypothetical protein
MARLPSDLMIRGSMIACAALGLFTSAERAHAQQWNDARTTALVEAATTRRTTQLADTALVDYRARAHGYLTFLAQVGAGFPEPPKIVKADELALEVFWQAPDRSKQFILGRRDTLLLPTDIRYHRDHLGIVQNNFPDIIRLGEGDEVRDVPHPLSLAGFTQYDFAITDSLQLGLGPRLIDVYEVRVRPRDDRAPRLVGAVYIERESADLVRMAFGFTRAALKDRSLEDLAIVLENGLIEGRFWLPRRQEIEIRRTGTWLDYPVRTIIRGRWEICCYSVNVGLHPSLFTGPEIVRATPRLRAPGDTVTELFTGNILDALPSDEAAVTDAEVRRVHAEARELVRAQALARARTPALAGTRISDFIRFNRVEGLALGAGLGQRFGLGFAVQAQGRYGFADDRWKGQTGLSYRRASGFAIDAAWRDTHVEAGDVQEVSLVRNSITAQELGVDYTEPFNVRGLVTEVLVPIRTARIAVGFADERHRGLSINAQSAWGSFNPPIAAEKARVRTVLVRFEQPTRVGGAVRLRYRMTAGAHRVVADTVPVRRYGRATAMIQLDRAFGHDHLILDLFAAAVGGGGGGGTRGALLQHHVFLGGPVSAPGFDFHQHVGRRGAFAHLEWRTPRGFPSISLGRFGRTPPRATFAPFLHATAIGAAPESSTARTGVFPSVGIAVMPFFELLRIDVARGLRDGRWSLNIDVTRDLWPVL